MQYLGHNYIGNYLLLITWFTLTGYFAFAWQPFLGGEHSHLEDKSTLPGGIWQVLLEEDGLWLRLWWAGWVWTEMDSLREHSRGARGHCTFGPGTNRLHRGPFPKRLTGEGWMWAVLPAFRSCIFIPHCFDFYRIAFFVLFCSVLLYFSLFAF